MKGDSRAEQAAAEVHYCERMQESLPGQTTQPPLAAVSDLQHAVLQEFASLQETLGQL